MIIFDSIIPKTNTTSILRFKNEGNAIIDIPIENAVANTISLYLAKISESSSVERGNIELPE